MGVTAPVEVTEACAYWVLRRSKGTRLSLAQIARRTAQMTPTQIQEARAEHARASEARKEG